MTTVNELKTKVQLDYGDQRNFISFCTLEKKPYQKFLIVGIVVIGGAMFLLKDSQVGWFNVAGFGAIIAMLMLLGKPRKRVDDDQTPWMIVKCPFVVTLSQEGILEAPAEPSAEVPERSSRWEELQEAYENSNYFYIFRRPEEAFILQKARMEGGEAEAVRQFLACKMGERFKAKK